MAAIPPSGEQFEIAHDDQRVVIAQVGASLREYTVGDRHVVEGYAVDAMADGGRGQVLAPWPNRVKDGSWSWQGKEMQLPLTEPAQHNAIHGFVRWLGWELVDRSDSSVHLGCTTFPQPGYSWPVRVEATYSLDDAGLTVTFAITNLGSTPAPVACGTHPYVTVGTAKVDEALLEVPADTYLPTGQQQIPTGREPVDGTPYDFRNQRAIGATEIDYAFTDLHRDDGGRCVLRLSAPNGPTVSLWLDSSFPYLEVFTGDSLPDPRRRRRGLGVEPMSAPPNALATGEDLVVLAPGESWTGQWGIQPR